MTPGRFADGIRRQVVGNDLSDGIREADTMMMLPEAPSALAAAHIPAVSAGSTCPRMIRFMAYLSTEDRKAMNMRLCSTKHIGKWLQWSPPGELIFWLWFVCAVATVKYDQHFRNCIDQLYDTPHHRIYLPPQQPEIAPYKAPMISTRRAANTPTDTETSHSHVNLSQHTPQ